MQFRCEFIGRYLSQLKLEEILLVFLTSYRFYLFLCSTHSCTQTSSTKGLLIYRIRRCLFFSYTRRSIYVFAAFQRCSNESGECVVQRGKSIALKDSFPSISSSIKVNSRTRKVLLAYSIDEFSLLFLSLSLFFYPFLLLCTQAFCTLATYFIIISDFVVVLHFPDAAPMARSIWQHKIILHSENPNKKPLRPNSLCKYFLN